MTEQKLLEHWIHGCAVQPIMSRDGLVLNLEDYNELVISKPITLTLPAIANSPAEVVSINPQQSSRPRATAVRFLRSPTTASPPGSCTANITATPPACRMARCGWCGATCRTTARISRLE